MSRDAQWPEVVNMKMPFALVFLLSLGPLAHAGSKEAGPAEVDQLFYQLANQGKCADAERLFTPESLEAIKAAMGSSDGFLQYCAGRGGKAALAKLSVAKTQRSGDRARVMLERSYQDGSLSLEGDDLVKVGGEWKLSVGADQRTTGRK